MRIERDDIRAAVERRQRRAEFFSRVARSSAVQLHGLNLHYENLRAVVGISLMACPRVHALTHARTHAYTTIKV